MAKLFDILSSEKADNITLVGLLWSTVASGGNILFESFEHAVLNLDPMLILSDIFFVLSIICTLCYKKRTGRWINHDNSNKIAFTLIVLGGIGIGCVWVGSPMLSSVVQEIGTYVLILGLAVLAILPDNKALTTA